MYPVGRSSNVFSPTGRSNPSKHAVVVGGGWAGFGAAYALLKAGVKVTILDASQTPGGLSSGWRTPGGRFVEAGIKGYSVMSTNSSCFCNKSAFYCFYYLSTLIDQNCQYKVLGMHGSKRLLTFIDALQFWLKPLGIILCLMQVLVPIQQYQCLGRCAWS